MADPSSPPSGKRPTTITDLNMDSLVQCAGRLSLRDLSNMAMSCKYLMEIAYSDSIWLSLFRERWPPPIPYCQTSSIRDAYLSRCTAVQQFKFEDPLVADLYTDLKSHGIVLLDNGEVIFSQGPFINKLKINSFLNGNNSIVTLEDHRARVTCMRLFSLNDNSFYRSELQRNNVVLVTSSLDHSIRLWIKGSCY